MKNKNLFLSFLLSFFCVLSANAQNVNEMPTITVTGTAEIRVVPDEAIFNLSVVKINRDLKIAQQENDATVAQIINLAKQFNVPAQYIKTDVYEYEEKYTWTGKDNEKRVFLGYEVSKDVVIRLTDMTKFEDLFREIIRSGVSKVEDVELQTTEIRKHKDRARAMAMKAAQEKAAAMAGEIGQSVGKAVMVREGVFSGSPYSNFSANSNVTSNTIGTGGQSYSAGYSASENSTFSIGTISVKADVTVSFLLN